MNRDSPLRDPTHAVEVEDLVVRYHTNVEKVPTLKTKLRYLGRRGRTVRKITALRGISFDVPSGIVLGIIGANGAGKTTLLRSIAGIIPPSEGRVVVQGQVSTLLSLGIGFNKTLSGRENVFLGGLAAGRAPDEVEERFDEIVEFADLGDWIDMPVNTYSSGMYGRLAFSVAVHVDPEILLIDETLSAGDARFRAKAKSKILELVEQAGTILLVTHGLSSVTELADRCLWLHGGRIKGLGDPEETVDRYTEFMKVEQSETVMEEI